MMESGTWKPTVLAQELAAPKSPCIAASSARNASTSGSNGSLRSLSQVADGPGDSITRAWPGLPRAWWIDARMNALCRQRPGLPA